MRWAINRTESTDPVLCANYAAHCAEIYDKGEDLTFGGFLLGEDVQDQRLALIARLKTVCPRTGYVKLGGFWTRKSLQGNGLMTEAIGKLAGYAFTALGTNRLEATYAHGNESSRKVMLNAGFREEAFIEKAHALPDGTMVGEHILVRSASSDNS